MLEGHARTQSRQNEEVAYFIALASAFLVVSAATALRPGRRGIFATLAYPVGWAAGDWRARESFWKSCWSACSGGGVGPRRPG